MPRIKRRRADSEAAVNAARNIERMDEHNAINDLKFVMSNPSGRRFVHRVIDACAPQDDGIPIDMHGRCDPLALASIAGAHAVSEGLLDLLKEHCPDEWMLMLAERIQEPTPAQAEEAING